MAFYSSGWRMCALASSLSVQPELAVGDRPLGFLHDMADQANLRGSAVTPKLRNDLPRETQFAAQRADSAGGVDGQDFLPGLAARPRP